MKIWDFISSCSRFYFYLNLCLLQAERKLVKAEQALSKVEAFLTPTKRQAEPDSITEEERFMFRKLGLRMKAFLLLGKTTLSQFCSIYSI